jgi:hypothetical protein
MSLSRVVIIAAICLGLTAAAAQQRETVSTACGAAQRGTVNCPNYTAPAAIAVPGASMDGSMMVPPATSTILFNGKVPPNAFMVQAVNAGTCFVNDNGPAAGVSGGGPAGFYVLPTAMGVISFMTPPGYRPIGPVSIWCNTPLYVAARGW